ncbi:MAG: hypothetical protein JJU18_03530 [Oceanicaulis sp.]|nr:hypothetical protein [Oceanicaulis sp.]
MNRPDKVMRPVLAAIALLAACVPGASLLTACAGAPVDMSAGLTNGAGQRSDVRQSASELRALVEDEGWTLTGGTPLLSRLIRGSAPDSAPAVTRYIETAGEGASARLIADAGRVTALSRRTADRALAAAAEPGAGPERLAGDLASVEGALAAVRRAKVFFTAAADKAEADDEHLTSAFSELHEAEQHLALAADALAERRWAVRHGAVS